MIFKHRPWLPALSAKKLVVYDRRVFLSGSFPVHTAVLIAHCCCCRRRRFCFCFSSPPCAAVAARAERRGRGDAGRHRGRGARPELRRREPIPSGRSPMDGSARNGLEAILAGAVFFVHVWFDFLGRCVRRATSPWLRCWWIACGGTAGTYGEQQCSTGKSRYSRVAGC